MHSILSNAFSASREIMASGTLEGDGERMTSRSLLMLEYECLPLINPV